jgi:signal transduction histidine kinase
VEDSGIGIAEKELPLLFNRFHRGGNATAYPGSGLGLAIVRSIVRQHGGDVAAANTGRGAVFTIWLPLG